MEKTKTTLDTVRKINFIDTKLFDKKNRNFYSKYYFAYENLCKEMLHAHFPNYGWFTHFDILAKKLYIFNSAVIPEGKERPIFIPKIKSFDLFHDKVLDIASEILDSKGLPACGDEEQIKQLVLENETKLKEALLNEIR